MSETTVQDLDRRLIRLEQIADNTTRSLDRLERAVDGLRASLDGVRTSQDSFRTSVEAEFREMRRTHQSDFRWLLSLQLASWASLLGLMAHGFRWIP